MKTILKYPITLGLSQNKEEELLPTEIETYEEAEFMSIQMNFGQPTMWFKVDTTKPKQKLKFRIFATGEEIPEEDNFVYYGTLQINRGEWVWHIFEILES